MTNKLPIFINKINVDIVHLVFKKCHFLHFLSWNIIPLTTNNISLFLFFTIFFIQYTNFFLIKSALSIENTLFHIYCT